MENITYDTELNRQLWIKHLAGDDDAFCGVYNNHVNILFAYGMHFTSNREMLKDCIQDVFIKIYVSRERLQQVDNVKFYLYTAMKNTLYNLFKKEVEHYQIDTMELDFHVDYPIENSLIENETLHEQKKNIARIMELLTPRQREIIYYRCVEELSYDEICSLMQMNYQSVRNLFHRTILKIRGAVTDIGVLYLLAMLFK